MKDWVKEIFIGVILLAVGIALTYYYLPEVIKVVLGVIGPLLLFLGIIFAWIGMEDKKLERELQELEKELEEESESKKKQQ